MPGLWAVRVLPTLPASRVTWSQDSKPIRIPPTKLPTEQFQLLTCPRSLFHHHHHYHPPHPFASVPLIQSRGGRQNPAGPGSASSGPSSPRLRGGSRCSGPGYLHRGGGRHSGLLLLQEPEKGLPQTPPPPTCHPHQLQGLHHR